MITPWLLTAAGVPFKRAPKRATPKTLMCGSVISMACQREDTVWGSGLVCDKAKFSPPRKVLAVRGPLTRKALARAGVHCPEVYGDIALLAPRFYTPPTPHQKWPVGIVPHYRDLHHKTYLLEPGARIISPLRRASEVPEFIDEVCSCERIISSSLHGIIIAEAYGVPAEWVEYSSMVRGRGFKFRDYFASRKLVDLDALWEARPWA
jgi:pyruvyltransferase